MKDDETICIESLCNIRRDVRYIMKRTRNEVTRKRKNRDGKKEDFQQSTILVNNPFDVHFSKSLLPCM